MLTIVPTPIGNLKDITLRALDALKECDAVICEDSRRTGLLLQQFQIHKPYIVLNDFNENRTYAHIIERLQLGQNLCLVSDAGTPLVSDPGFKLIREAIKENIEIDSLPGPVAAITALTLSALPPDKFIFLGYLPEKSGQRTTLLTNLKTVQETLRATYIIYVAPHKLVRTLSDIQTTLGDIPIVLAKELTKIHQNVQNKSVSEWLTTFKKANPKGEFIMLFNLSVTESADQ